MQVQCTQNCYFGPTGSLPGSPGVILVLLGPVGAYWFHFCGHSMYKIVLYPVYGFSGNILLCNFCQNPVTPLLHLILQAEVLVPKV